MKTCLDCVRKNYVIVMIADEDESVNPYSVFLGDRHQAYRKPSNGPRDNIVPELNEILGEPDTDGTFFGSYKFIFGYPYGSEYPNFSETTSFPVGHPDSGNSRYNLNHGSDRAYEAPGNSRGLLYMDEFVYKAMYRNSFNQTQFQAEPIRYPEPGDPRYDPEFFPDNHSTGEPRDIYTETAKYLNDFMESEPAGLVGVVIVPVGNFSDEYVSSLPWPHNVQNCLPEKGIDEFADDFYDDGVLTVPYSAMQPRMDKSKGYHEQYVDNLNYFKSLLTGLAAEKIIVTDPVDPESDYSDTIVDAIESLEEKYPLGKTDYILNYIDSTPSFDYVDRPDRSDDAYYPNASFGRIVEAARSGPDFSRQLPYTYYFPYDDEEIQTEINVDSFWNYRYIKFAQTFPNYFSRYSSQELVDEMTRLQSLPLPPLLNNPDDTGSPRKGGRLLIDMSALGYVDGVGTKHIFLNYYPKEWLGTLMNTVFGIGMHYKGCESICKYRWTTYKGLYTVPAANSNFTFEHYNRQAPYVITVRGKYGPGSLSLLGYFHVCPLNYYFNRLQRNGTVLYENFLYNSEVFGTQYDNSGVFPRGRGDASVAVRPSLGGGGGSNSIIPEDLDLYQYYNGLQYDEEEPPVAARVYLKGSFPGDRARGLPGPIEITDVVGNNEPAYFRQIYHNSEVSASFNYSPTSMIYVPPDRNGSESHRNAFYDLSPEDAYQAYFGVNEAIYSGALINDQEFPLRNSRRGTSGIGQSNLVGRYEDGEGEDFQYFTAGPIPAAFSYFGTARYPFQRWMGCDCTGHYPINNYIKYVERSQDLTLNGAEEGFFRDFEDPLGEEESQGEQNGN